MDSVPDVKVGDIVQIAYTDDMLNCRLAGICGRVVFGGILHASVDCDDGVLRCIKASHLNVVNQFYKKWKEDGIDTSRGHTRNNNGNIVEVSNG